MLATVLHGPRDVRYEHIDEPKILKPTDAIIKLAATCVCGSDLWPYRGLQPMDGPARERNTADAVAYCLAHPRWRLSLQTHKLLGIP